MKSLSKSKILFLKIMFNWLKFESTVIKFNIFVAKLTIIKQFDIVNKKFHYFSIKNFKVKSSFLWR